MTDLVCAVDAGGTKTACVLATTAGEIVARAAAGPGALRQAGDGIGAVVGSITEVCARAGVEPAALRATVVGMAYVDTPAARARAEGELRTALRGVDFSVCNDAEIALETATSARPGMVLISGTGSIAYGEDGDGRALRVGGWGPVFGDEGSGFDIARRAVKGLLRAIDGRGPMSILAADAKRTFGLAETAELVELTDPVGADAGRLAAFAPTVFVRAAEGDGLATDAIEGAAAELAEQALALIGRLGAVDGCPVGLAGGIFEHHGAYGEVVGRRIAAAAPGSQLIRSALPPVIGGVLVAVRAVDRGRLEGARTRLAASPQAPNQPAKSNPEEAER